MRYGGGRSDGVLDEVSRAIAERGLLYVLGERAGGALHVFGVFPSTLRRDRAESDLAASLRTGRIAASELVWQSEVRPPTRPRPPRRPTRT